MTSLVEDEVKEDESKIDAYDPENQPSETQLSTSPLRDPTTWELIKIVSFIGGFLFLLTGNLLPFSLLILVQAWR